MSNILPSFLEKIFNGLFVKNYLVSTTLYQLYETNDK